MYQVTQRQLLPAIHDLELIVRRLRKTADRLEKMGLDSGSIALLLLHAEVEQSKLYQISDDAPGSDGNEPEPQ